MLLYKTFLLGFSYKVELRYDEAFLVYFTNMICFPLLFYFTNMICFPLLFTIDVRSSTAET